MVVPACQADRAIERAKLTFHSFMLRYASIETKGPAIAVANKGAVPKDMQVMIHNSTWNLIHCIEQLPHGVFKYFSDAALPDLVETSQNLARANIPAAPGAKEAFFQTFARSAVDSYMAGIADINDKIAKAHGGKCVLEHDDVGGWPADMHSRLLTTMREQFKAMEGKEAECMAIHAGLENSVIMNKYPELQLESVSIGPTVLNPHTTYESMHVSTAIKCYELIKRTVEALAQ